MKVFLSLCIIASSTALRLSPENTADDVQEITVGLITFPERIAKNTTSFNLKQESSNTLSVWQTRQEHVFDVKVSLSDKSKHEVTSASDWTPQTMKTSKFLKEIIKDLAVDKVQKMQKCGVLGQSVGHADQARKKMSQMSKKNVWVILSPETVTGKELAKYAPEGAIILGNGYDEAELDKYNVDGRKLHNLWFPFAFQAFIESDTSPMELMTRDHSKAVLRGKSDDLSVVYQQSKCYAEREEGWDEVCQGVNSIGQKCFAMGVCNGNKHLGVPAPFASAGSRDSKHWINDAISNYEKFKFVYALEHTPNSFGYMTEKIFLPMQAGAIPIYTGDKHALDAIGVNPKSYIYMTPDTRKEALEEMKTLLKNEDEFKARVGQPVMSEQKFKEYFTWHSSTWSTYGDQARQKIINAIVDICN